MSTRILLTGQCTLHWGRMEFGNVGNYYIIEPFVRNLHRVFPDAEIHTTFQMSDAFCEREGVVVVPMECYYGWTGTDLSDAKSELEAARSFAATGHLPHSTPFIDQVTWADLVIDFSGDIWGDNANFLGDNRFTVGLIKDWVAQLMGKPTVLLAGSPGPFDDVETTELAKQVFRQFDLVTNREAVSTGLLAAAGFDLPRTESLACPAFLFEAADRRGVDVPEAVVRAEKPVAGLILCGWNFTKGPFDRWPREDAEYDYFAAAVEFMTEDLGLRVCLMSHSNGFPLPPRPFELRHGRDYPIAQQLADVLTRRGITTDVHVLDGVYDPWQTKAIIGGFDMLVSGRVHGAVAGLSQEVPTVIIDYGHEPRAHKLKGFAEVVQVEAYVADPARGDDLVRRINRCWHDRMQIREHLRKRMPEVKRLARRNFDLLPALLEMGEAGK
jgi:colanic acid/amylovoran biosynthesis protein